ncbi:MAG: di-heme oxidoredictase family protein [Bacteroidota bacterium]
MRYRNTLSVAAIILCFVLAVVSCQKLMPPEPPHEEVLGAPLEGLTQEQLLNHVLGDEEFGRVFGSHDGLGPIYVATSCEGCHIGDGKGHPLTTLTRFNRYTGVFYDPMADKGGPQLQHRAISGYQPEIIPAAATGVTRLLPPSVAGLGFLEAVPDAAILAMADSTDVNGDGVSGVPNLVTAPPYFIAQSWHIPVNGKYIGRFGRKAGAINLLQQTANAYLNDIGITSDFNMEDLYNVQVGNYSGDHVPDPEVSASTVNNVVFYLRTLKVPPRRNTADADVQAGENIFMQVGCAKCHVPSLTTGYSEVEALSYKTFYPYTDLLMHDMGPGLDDGYTEGTAATSEWRTTPLWGLGLQQYSQGGQMFLMHDGRAATIEEAINLHGGEASGSRTQYQALSQADKDKLIKFLMSL